MIMKFDSSPPTFEYFGTSRPRNPLSCLSVCLSLSLSVCMSICMSICCVCFFLSLFVCLPFCLSIYLTVHLYICLSVCQSICNIVQSILSWQRTKNNRSKYFLRLRYLYNLQNTKYIYIFSNWLFLLYKAVRVGQRLQEEVFPGYFTYVILIGMLILMEVRTVCTLYL